MKRVAILGSTGSIGRQAIGVITANRHMFQIISLAAGSDVQALAAQARAVRPQRVAVADAAGYSRLKAELSGTGIELLAGEESLCQLAGDVDSDIVLNAVVGFPGLAPALAAASAGKTIALANKESLVAGGHLIMPAVKAGGAVLVPVDSEHSAIFQCLHGQDREAVAKLILTASGGPFYGFGREELERVTAGDALKHPNWSMGPKISVDSATLMNKGLEVIEAHWLFGVSYEKIEVIIHRESIIHSMVEFVDGSTLAQLGAPDMKVPIQYALTFPERRPGQAPRLSWRELPPLHFDAPDTATFPCLGLAFLAGRAGGSLPAVLNAANEAAVAAFLAGRCSFLDIPRIIEEVMNKHNIVWNPSLAELTAIDREARLQALQSAWIMKG